MTTAIVGDFTHLFVVFIVAYRDVRALLHIPKGYEAHGDAKFNIVCRHNGSTAHIFIRGKLNT